MPEMGRKDLLYSIKQRKSNIPVIALSGYYQNSEIIYSGFYEILNKPLDLSKISEIFYKIFSGKKEIETKCQFIAK
jgi:DNA-binding NtrC family response regulator